MRAPTRETWHLAATILIVVGMSLFLGAAPPIWTGSFLITVGVGLIGLAFYRARTHPEGPRALVWRLALTAGMTGFMALDKFYPDRGFATPAMGLLAGFLIFDNRLKLRDTRAKLAKWLSATAFMRWYASVPIAKR